MRRPSGPWARVSGGSPGGCPTAGTASPAGGRTGGRRPAGGGPRIAGVVFTGAFEVGNLERLTGEVFGPILHVIRFGAGDLDRVIAAINGTGYGLTFGVHSRIDRTVTRLTAGVRTGNRYVNRNLIGAVVGVQPFGGEGLSGTGPKAGGPAYRQRFTTERVLTINTAATGGNLDLLSRSD